MAYLLVAFVLLTAAAPPPQNGGSAPSWPGIWGPARNGSAVAAGTPARPSGFKELWRRKTQGGYSEVAAYGTAVFTGEASGGTDYIVSIDSATGKERWRSALGQTYRGHDGSHDGPIARQPSMAATCSPSALTACWWHSRRRPARSGGGTIW